MRTGSVTALALGLSVTLSAAASASARSDQDAIAPAQSLTGGPGDVIRIVTTGCERWRSLAARLGETHAGHKLRVLLASRPCAVSEERAVEAVWSWPWRFGDVPAELPPQRHGSYGAWEIRCGEAGERRRCALLLETGLAAGVDPETRPVRVVSHVVIATVAGRESILWRVHVARRVSAGAGDGGVSVELPGRKVLEAFDACGNHGCMAEAEPAVGAEVASTLWLGRPITITLGGAGDREPETGMLPAHGFRAGLKELIRLRRQEARPLAGR